MPLTVSVVIVTRNRLAELERAVQSVLAQDVAVEIIVVDNASDDATPQAFPARYPQAIYLRQPVNTGAPEGRNIGIAAATGDLCFCMDDDAELIAPGTIARAAAYFETNGNLACLHLRVLDQHGRIVTKLLPRRDRRLTTQPGPAAMFSATGCMIRRSAFLAVGGFWEKLNPYFGEEPELAWKLLAHGYTLMEDPTLPVRHYETPVERPLGRRLYYGTRNAPWMALRHLPWPAAASLIILAWGYFFLVSLKERSLRMYLRACAASLREWPAVMRQRKSLPPAACRALRRYSGLYWY